MITMDGASLRFGPKGELTIYQVEEATKALAASFARAKDILIDLSPTDKIDTAGFQLLVALHKSCKAAGKEITIDGLGGSIENFMALFGYAFDGATRDKQ